MAAATSAASGGTGFIMLYDKSNQIWLALPVAIFTIRNCLAIGAVEISHLHQVGNSFFCAIFVHQPLNDLSYCQQKDLAQF